MISFRLDDARALPGETIRGEVSWAADQKAPEAVTVTAGLVTEGRGSTDTVTVYEQTIADPPIEGTAAFDFIVPVDSPCTYDGRLIRVRWRVEVRLDLPWAMDERDEAPFVVVAS